MDTLNFFIIWIMLNLEHADINLDITLKKFQGYHCYKYQHVTLKKLTKL